MEQNKKENIVQSGSNKSDLNPTELFMKPLFTGHINELSNTIHDQQFFDYDITIGAGAEQVLDALQNLKSNPLLLDYVLKCLANQQILTIPNKFYAVIINKEHIKQYDETFWKQIDPENPFERWKKECVDADFDKKKEDILFPIVFDSIAEIENYMLDSDKVKSEISAWSTHKDNENILYEKYSIHQVGI